ncbi:MAG: DUF4867 family protein [Lachnospira sp.]
MKIYSVMDDNFKKYGRIIKNIALSSVINAMESTPVPDDVVYVPEDASLMNTGFAADMKNRYFGEYPVQVGFCNGHNQKLNAVEYHRSSEVNVACTDMILLLGKQQDIEEDFTYNTDNIEAFLVGAGTAVEIYATTLHYAPCGVDGKGFKCVVVLPQGTNYDLKMPAGTEGEDKLLNAANKWLIAHKDANIQGAFIGLKGENLSV